LSFSIFFFKFHDIPDNKAYDFKNRYSKYNGL